MARGDKGGDEQRQGGAGNGPASGGNRGRPVDRPKPPPSNPQQPGR